MKLYTLEKEKRTNILNYLKQCYIYPLYIINIFSIKNLFIFNFYVHITQQYPQ